MTAFSVTDGSETSKLWRRKELFLLCIRKACMLRYCALSRSLVKIRRQDRSLAHFSKTLRSLCLILCWRAVVKSKNKFNNILRQGLLFIYVYFLFPIFHSNQPKKRGKESLVLKNPFFFALRISFIQWRINETITKLFWKFEENWTSRQFDFSNKKKEHKEWNPLYSKTFSEIGYTGHSSIQVLSPSTLVTARRTDSLFPTTLTLWASGREWGKGREREREREKVSKSAWERENGLELHWRWEHWQSRSVRTHARQVTSVLTRSLHCRFALNVNERFVKSKYWVKGKLHSKIISSDMKDFFP